MSEPWTDETIREAFIYDGGESEYHDPEHGAQTQRKIAGDIFDMWLAEHDRQVAERAWDAGFDKATSLVSEDFWSDAWSDDHSPHRAAKGEQK